MEIHNYSLMLQKSNINVIFVTGDLVNALMSVAENISTIYTHVATVFDGIKIRNIDNTLYTTANAFEQCNFVIRTSITQKEEKYKLKCVWEGKTVEEWSSKKIQFDKL